jgi:hypothetical protein
LSFSHMQHSLIECLYDCQAPLQYFCD